MRYQHASEMGADLKRLKRDLDSAQLVLTTLDGRPAKPCRNIFGFKAGLSGGGTIESLPLRFFTELLMLIQVMYLGLYSLHSGETGIRRSDD